MEVKIIKNRNLIFLIISLLLFQIIQCSLALPSIFGDIHGEYLHKLVRSTKSSEMANYLNVEIDPCTNFYGFACGNYQRINPPNDFRANNIFQDLSESMYRKFLSLIKHNETADSLVEMKVKNFYESCTNLAILRNTYRTKIREIINEFGHMPALEGDNWRDSNYFDWLKTIALINRRYGIVLIMGPKVMPDIRNKKLNALYILPQTAPLGSAEAYMDPDQEDVRNLRKQNILYNLKYMFGLRTAMADKTAKEIFEFESHLFAGYQDDNGTESNGSLDIMSVDNMQIVYTNFIDIKRLLELTLGYLPSEKVFDLIKDSAQNIHDTLSRSPIRVMANYVFYSLIENFLLIPNPVEKNMENFMILSHARRRHELEKVCIMETEKHFPEFLDNMFYRKYMSHETELSLEPLWENLKLSFQGLLDANRHKGMIDIYKVAVDKLQAMRLQIRSYKDRNFASEYEALNLSKHDYLENLKSILAHKAEWSRKYLNTTKYAEFSIGRKTLYIPFENSIALPVALLQPYYLWSDSYPAALQYASIGFLIARQLIHSLQFSAFDKAGNLNLKTQECSKLYLSKIQPCFELQYHSYYMEGRPLPKLQSPMENVADSGAIRVAFNAYMRWKGQMPENVLKDEQLPTLNYSSPQLFFITFGQMLCSAGHDLSEAVNNFAVEPYRVNQALANLEDFSNNFHCSQSSNMNPHTKCTIY